MPTEEYVERAHLRELGNLLFVLENSKTGIRDQTLIIAHGMDGYRDITDNWEINLDRG